MPNATITTELVSSSITTEFNTDTLNNFFTYTIPFLMPGGTDSTEMSITTENIKISIITEC